MCPLATNDLSNMSTASPIPTDSVIGNGPLGWSEGVLLMRTALFTNIIVSRRCATLVSGDFPAIASKLVRLMHAMKHSSMEPLRSLSFKFSSNTLHNEKEYTDVPPQLLASSVFVFLLLNAMGFPTRP